jgi:hypothetical protein
MASNIQLQSSAVDPLLRGLVDSSVVKVPFVKPPMGAVSAPFTHTRASFGLNTALPSNCALPFNSFLSVPQYCLISNSFLKVTVQVPANTQPMQWAPIYMWDSIDLLNADGRSFWQARPESTFVYINQCMEADLKLAAKTLVLAAESDCTDAAAAGVFTALIPLVHLPWNNLDSHTAAWDLRAFAPQLRLYIRWRAASEWMFATGSGGTVGNTAITDCQLVTDLYDLSNIGPVAASYVPRTQVTRAWEYQTFDMPAEASGVTSATYTFALTALSQPSTLFFAYVVAYDLADGSRTTPLPWDAFYLSASGSKLIDPPLTAMEGALEQARLFPVGPFGGFDYSTLPNVISWSFALPGYATGHDSDACGAFSFRKSVNPTMTVTLSGASLQTHRTCIVVSSTLSTLRYTGAYGAQRVEIGDAL